MTASLSDKPAHTPEQLERIRDAAPELLEALRDMLDHYGPPATIAKICDYPDWHPIFKARAAIARATGAA